MGRFDGILICSDIDGTFAHGTTVCEENVKAIEFFQSQGGRFTWMTGRTAGYQATFPLRINAPMVSDNGTRITDAESGRTLWTFPLDGSGPLLEWLDQQTSIAVVLVFEDALIRLAPGEIVPAFLEHTTGDLLKIVCAKFDSPQCAMEFRDRAISVFGSRYQAHRSWDVGVEFLSPLGGKGNCLNLLRSILEGEISTVIAIGDYENDLSMLRAADRSFAPSNACPEVLNAAQTVLCSCKDGALGALIHLLDRELS